MNNTLAANTSKMYHIDTDNYLTDNGRRFIATATAYDNSWRVQSAAYCTAETAYDEATFFARKAGGAVEISGGR